MSRILRNDKVPLSNNHFPVVFQLDLARNLQVGMISCERGPLNQSHLRAGSKAPNTSGCPDLSSAKTMFSQAIWRMGGG